jgi:hypothetical protein
MAIKKEEAKTNIPEKEVFKNKEDFEKIISKHQPEQKAPETIEKIAPLKTESPQSPPSIENRGDKKILVIIGVVFVVIFVLLIMTFISILIFKAYNEIDTSEVLFYAEMDFEYPDYSESELPDLVIEEASLYKQGKYLFLEAVVINNGRGKSDETYLILYYDGKKLHQSKIKELFSGSGVEVNVSNIPTDYKSDEFTLKLNPNKTFQEVTYENNIAIFKKIDEEEL